MMFDRCLLRANLDILIAFCIPSVRRRLFAEAEDKEKETRSPFDIKGVKTNITREEIIEAIHEGRGNDRW